MSSDFNTDLNRVVARPVITNVKSLVVGGVDFAGDKCRWIPLSLPPEVRIEINVKGYNFYDVMKKTSFGLPTTKTQAPRDLSWDDPLHKQNIPEYPIDPTPVNGNDMFDTLTLYVSSDCPNMWDESITIQEYDLYSKYVRETDQSPTLAERFPSFQAYQIPRADIMILNQNELSFKLPPPRVSGLINVIIANRAGYGMCDTDTFHGLDQQAEDQTARFSTGVSSNGMIVVGTGSGCMTPPPPDAYAPLDIPCDYEEWF